MPPTDEMREICAGIYPSLLAALDDQPSWSDLPVILLRSPRAHRRLPMPSLLMPSPWLGAWAAGLDVLALPDDLAQTSRLRIEKALSGSLEAWFRR